MTTLMGSGSPDRIFFDGQLTNPLPQPSKDLQLGRRRRRLLQMLPMPHTLLPPHRHSLACTKRRRHRELLDMGILALVSRRQPRAGT